jgi:hypothetical protein
VVFGGFAGLGAVWAVLEGAGDVGGAEALSGGGSEVAGVGGDHEELVWVEVEVVGGAEVDVRVGFEVAEEFGGEDVVPGEVCVLGHVCEQFDVAVAEGGDGVVFFELR